MKKFISAFMLMAVMAFSVSTFVSCNDLADEVEAVNDKANANEKDIEELQSALDAVKERLTTAENDHATKAALTALETKLTEAINNRYTKAEVDALLEVIRGNVTTLQGQAAQLEAWKLALTEYLGLVEKDGKVNSPAIDKALADIDQLLKDMNEKGGKVANLTDRVTAIEKNIEENIAPELVRLEELIYSILKSMVFVPEVYVDGVEADKYVYAAGNYVDATTAATATTITPVNGAANETYEVPAGQPLAWDDDDEYAIPSVQEMLFHLNPKKANLAGVEWSFLNASPEKIETRADAATVVYYQKNEESVPVVNDKGLLPVKYKVENPNLLHPETETANYLSIAALQATFEEKGAVVVSDYATIYPSTVTFKNLAYIATATVADDCETATLGDHLYTTAEDVILKDPSVKVLYNVGKLELAKMINIHYTAEGAEGHKTMTLAEAAENYGLTVNFDSFEYKSGLNKTEENAYLHVEANGDVTPMWVNAEEASVKIGKDETTAGARSSVGREPAVLVTLLDGENIVLAGYIKLQIVDKDPTPVEDVTVAIEINKAGDEDKLAYICATQDIAINWKDMSGKIIAELDMTKDEFVDNYNIVADSTFVRLADVNGKPKFEGVAGNKYGTVAEMTDADIALTNDIITYYFTKAEIDEILKSASYKANGTFTLYAKYKNVAGEQPAFVYIGITVKVAELPAVISWGKKADAAWYPKTADLAERDTVRFNVPAPTTDGIATSNVLNYEKNVDEYFYHILEDGSNVKGIELTLNEYDAVYKTDDNKAEIEALRYEYVFSDKNTFKIDDSKTTVEEALSVSADQKELKWAGVTVAKIQDDGRIVYINNPTSQRFLNLFSHDAPKGQHQYAIIEIVANYGKECDIKIPVADSTFNVRFLRPIDIIQNPAAELNDAEANGATVSLGSFFTIMDWRDKDVVVYEQDEVTEKWAAVTPEDKGVNLFEYYKISSVEIHLDQATSDFNKIGTQMPINKDVIDLSLTDADGNGVADVVDLTVGIGALNNTVLNYKNNEGNVGDFTIEVPVTVTYAWGNITVNVPVPVKHTIANE